MAPKARVWEPILPWIRMTSHWYNWHMNQELCALISHNIRHLRPAAEMGIQILKPGEFLRILAAQT